MRPLSKIALILAGAALAAGPLAAQKAAKTPEQVAEAALAASPVWDGHNDVPIQLRARRGNVLAEFDFNDTSHEPDGKGAIEAMHTDLPRLAKGRVGAQFWSVYVTADLSEPEAIKATIEQIDVTKRLIARYPDRLALALTAADVERAWKAKKVASLMGMEGGHSVGDSLAVLRQMYALGARYMTLTHSKNTDWADSAARTWCARCSASACWSI
jgi:membrane dipeptidase